MSSQEETTHAAPAAEHAADGHADHDHGAGIYVKTLLALLVLTVITVGASYVDFGSGNVVIALFIATVKASIVALFFMHLKDEKPVNGIIATAGFLFLGIFLMFCFIDQDTRTDPRPILAPAPVLNLPPGTIAGPNGTPIPAPAAAAAPETKK
jgi:cytochrome c oxidase subunit 4